MSQPVVPDEVKEVGEKCPARSDNCQSGAYCYTDLCMARKRFEVDPTS